MSTSLSSEYFTVCKSHIDEYEIDNRERKIFVEYVAFCEVYRPFHKISAEQYLPLLSNNSSENLFT
jgi:hypothetical protein